MKYNEDWKKLNISDRNRLVDEVNSFKEYIGNYDNYTSDDFLVYKNKERNLILKYKNIYYKIYENSNYLEKEYVVLKNLNRDVKKLNRGLIFNELPGETFSLKGDEESLLKEFKKSIEEFWSVNRKNINKKFTRTFGKKRIEKLFDAVGMANYENCLSIIKRWENIKAGEIVYAHGDLNPGNILIDSNKINFIDFELSSVNEKYFDLSSFIIENDLNSSQTEKIINIFKVEDKNDLYIYIKVFAIRTCVDWYIRYIDTNDKEVKIGYLAKLKVLEKLIK